ncbi:selenide, water dikinase SelD [Thiohalorhabdus denitrificans]|uniref:Selenophosphate synthase n=1 Tax=Thiohalorhabdus denitrificans TaxID=381306 RepID=A0A1G5C1Y6_9GAMM|nr:selenide, water dikinase SelD [Thiohalorhabdus denitrificans]SCX96398.1 selenophosphate synthase [Thiohalorhabdus denitrificans]
MKGSSNAPVLKDLVLVGGGHSHIAVLRRFGMRPEPGVRLTLVVRDVHTPYSGMLPGYVAGHYAYDECHIDLRPLARFAGARLIHAEAAGLDLEEGRVLCHGRPPVAYDLVSLDTGSRPDTGSVPGAAEHAIPVKPIDGWLARWERVKAEALEACGDYRVTVVGAGAGGVELALSVRHALRGAVADGGGDPDRLQIDLVSAEDSVLPDHNRRARSRFGRILRERGIGVYTGAAVAEVGPGGRLHLEDGRELETDAPLWVTRASAPEWPAASGLATDEAGFVAVNEHLQSTSHPEVFASGDIASMVGHPRPKSGVYAVRQGPPLAANLRRALLGRRLKRHIPQQEALAIISTGDRHAVAVRGRWAVEGDWLWHAKRRIDRRFMAKYHDLPQMEEDQETEVREEIAGGPEALKEIASVAMRCGGCGAKVGSSVLSRALARLAPVDRDDILLGLDAPDDAAVVEVPEGQVMVHTVDFFRAMVDDPYVFGQIAANHSLGDVFAMGADPQSALALATLPYGREEKVEEQIYQMMAGALSVFEDSNTALVGGHTGEGAELAFGFAINGLVARDRILRKGGMRPGDVLILTKPVGTGTLFAADMRHLAKGRWVAKALEAMVTSNRRGAELLFAHGATACTDVTGFGVLGHLVEMTKPSGVDVEVRLEDLPVLDGALETVRAGVFSSLQPENVRLRRAVKNPEAAGADERYPLLFDPQTAGGLLASVPEEAAADCLAALREAGYPEAAAIGRVREAEGGEESVTVVPAGGAVGADPREVGGFRRWTQGVTP